MRERQEGRVKATAGCNPVRDWTSRPFGSRDAATRYEAALRAWLDQRSDKFREHTGLDSIMIERERRVASMDGCLIPAMLLLLLDGLLPEIQMAV